MAYTGCRWNGPVLICDAAARGEKKFEECAALPRSRGEDNSTGTCTAFRPWGRTPQHFRRRPFKRSGYPDRRRPPFLADPQKVVPANRMPYAGLAEASDRADLIAYLQKAFP